MDFDRPITTDLLVANATANGTVATLMANRYFTADISMNAVQSIAGTNTATLTWEPTPGGSGAQPAGNQVLAQCTATGLVSSVGCNSSYTEILIYTGSSGGTLVFNTGGASAAGVTINGSHT